MEFFDKLGKKASEAYRVTADKTGKIAKETKLKIKMGDLKSKINDIYEEIGKIVYEKHVKKEEIDIEKDLIEQCTNIDVMSDEIEALLKECLELKDKKQCTKCFTEIEKDAKFCPHCGMKQEENKVGTQEELKKENQNEVQKENEVDEKEKSKHNEQSKENETSLTNVEERYLINVEKNEEEVMKENENISKEKEVINELREDCQENTKDRENDNANNDNAKSKEKETNIEKTTIIEINPTPENITEEEVKNIGADEK
ncbi:MAG: hypothetical protein ACLVA2_05780 [Clostridia bacterium]